MTTIRWSLKEDITQYQRAGVGAIGIWRQKVDTYGRKKSVQLLRDAKLPVSSVSFGGGFTGHNKYTWEEAVRDTHESILLAAAMKANCLVISSGPRAGHTKGHANEVVRDALQRLGDTAARYKVPLAVLPMHRMFYTDWTYLNTLDATLELLDEVNHPYVKMALDVYHSWQDPSFERRLTELTPYLSLVQISDGTRAPRSAYDRCLPGEGEIPLADIIDRLVDAGYDNYFEVQVWSEKLWSGDYQDTLSRCCDQMQSFARRQRTTPT